jgi:hypothetical protein
MTTYVLFGLVMGGEAMLMPILFKTMMVNCVGHGDHPHLMKRRVAASSREGRRAFAWLTFYLIYDSDISS